MLTAEEKEKIRQEIAGRLEGLRKTIENLREQSKPVCPDNAIGRITRMDAIQQRSVNEAALRKAENDQSLLEEAWSKIDAPDFGACVRCGKPIPLGRVLALPQTRICVSCAETRGRR